MICCEACDTYIQRSTLVITHDGISLLTLQCTYCGHLETQSSRVAAMPQDDGSHVPDCVGEAQSVLGAADRAVQALRGPPPREDRNSCGGLASSRIDGASLREFVIPSFLSGDFSSSGVA